VASSEAIPGPVDARLFAFGLPVLNVRWTMFAALVVLNLFDVITTAMVISRGGIEGNPVMQSVVDNMVHVGFLKAAVLGLIAVLLARSPESKVASLGVAAAAAWYLVVVSWNVLILTIV